MSTDTVSMNSENAVEFYLIAVATLLLLGKGVKVTFDLILSKYNGRDSIKLQESYEAYEVLIDKIQEDQNAIMDAMEVYLNKADEVKNQWGLYKTLGVARPFFSVNFPHTPQENKIRMEGINCLQESLNSYPSLDEYSPNCFDLHCAQLEEHHMRVLQMAEVSIGFIHDELTSIDNKIHQLNSKSYIHNVRL